MRIVGGIYKGRKLPVSSKLDLRPTTDFAKESLFNLLNTRKNLHAIEFLDLFSGSGGIAFELISRGAERGTCVDNTSSSYDYRDRIMNQLGIKGIRNLKADVFKFLPRCSTKFDLIFADPPYDHERLVDLPDLIFDLDLLLEGGLFVLEHPEEHTFGKHPKFSEHRRYGRVNFSFFNL